MDILDFLPEYPSIQNPSLEDLIYHKREFYENKLEAVEEFPSAKGELTRNQVTMSRLLSSRTPYDQILLAHQMGTGKTCSAIGAIEQIRHEPNSTFTGAVILAGGKPLLDNFMNELAFKCTAGEYIPDNYDSLTNLEKKHRLRKLYETYYEVNTFLTFARHLSRMKDANIISVYSNKIIVIDEVHNLSIKETI